MLTNSDCPGCHAQSEADSPNDGEVLVCIHCGYVGIWDEAEGGWRLLTPEEHSRCMESENFIQSLQFGIAFRTWRERDRMQMCSVLHSKLDRLGVPLQVLDETADELMAAGYHTHPSETDMRSLGLGEYGDDL
jgi:hypothetical protein